MRLRKSKRSKYLSINILLTKINTILSNLLCFRMQDLVESRGSSSSQLKPMHGSLRHAVCALARYYGLNAYEFDSDPRRYVSIGYQSSYYLFSLYSFCNNLFLFSQVARESRTGLTSLYCRY